MELTTKDRIMQESLCLFSQYGYDSVGVSKIVRTCGITKPTLYYYFGSKEGLLKCIIEHNAGKLRCRLLESYSTDDPFVAKLVSIADAYLEFTSEHVEFIRLFLSLVFTPHSNKAYGIVKTEAELIQKTIESLFIIDDNFRHKKDLLAASFVGQLNMFATLILNGYTRYDRELAKTIVTIFLNGAGSIL